MIAARAEMTARAGMTAAAPMMTARVITTIDGAMAKPSAGVFLVIRRREICQELFGYCLN
jgi:hydrogenase-4 membrane subunit HyfE